MRHHLKARGRMIFICLDHCSDYFAGLQHLPPGSPEILSQLQTCLAEFSRVAAGSPNHRALGALFNALGLGKRERVDDRFAFALAQIECHPQRFLTIAQEAALVNFSASRFQHLFRSKMGVPFRHDRLWGRRVLVIKILRPGTALQLLP
jgi:hypothetical protein